MLHDEDDGDDMLLMTKVAVRPPGCASSQACAAAWATKADAAMCMHQHSLWREKVSSKARMQRHARSRWVDFVDKGGQRPKFLITVIALAQSFL